MGESRATAPGVGCGRPFFLPSPCWNPGYGIGGWAFELAAYTE